jgi:hypothetical protein
MKNKNLYLALPVVSLMVAMGPEFLAQEQNSTPSPSEQRAIKILKEMSQFLAKAERFSVTIRDGYDAVQQPLQLRRIARQLSAFVARVGENRANPWEQRTQATEHASSDAAVRDVRWFSPTSYGPEIAPKYDPRNRNGRRCRHPPFPVDSKACKTRGAPGRQISFGGHSDQQLPQQRFAPSVRANTV